MLVEFRVANFRSFREEQVLSMVASKAKKDDTHPENLISGENFNLIKTAAIYGANASGKSNFIKAISCMYSLIEKSATKMNIGEKIRGIEPFRLDKKTINKPSEFEITYIDEGDRYIYGFSATEERVYKEWLYKFPKTTNRQNSIFEREYNKKTNEYNFEYKGLKKEKSLLKERTRENGLVLSRGADLNIERLKEVFLWVKNNFRILYMFDPPFYLRKETLGRLDENLKYREMILKMIQHADMGIDRLEVEKEVVNSKELRTKAGVYKIIKRKQGESAFIDYKVKSYHRTSEGEIVEFDWEKDESNGTQRFMALAGPCLDTMDKGTILLIDEIEASMHPLLTRKLIELLQSKQANKKGAQLIFATHDSTLMDPELFRRDQIWIVEKNKAGASELYSLYDFDTKERPRNTEKFGRNYLAGRYGGVPDFGPIFEDLEF